MKRYKVILCPNCGVVQSSSAETTFKCLRCGKSRTLVTKSSGTNVKILDSFDHPKQAALFVQEYNRLKAGGWDG